MIQGGRRAWKPPAALALRVADKFPALPACTGWGGILSAPSQAVLLKEVADAQPSLTAAQPGNSPSPPGPCDLNHEDKPSMWVRSKIECHWCMLGQAKCPPELDCLLCPSKEAPGGAEKVKCSNSSLFSPLQFRGGSGQSFSLPEIDEDQELYSYFASFYLQAWLSWSGAPRAAWADCSWLWAALAAGMALTGLCSNTDRSLAGGKRLLNLFPRCSHAWWGSVYLCDLLSPYPW